MGDATLACGRNTTGSPPATRVRCCSRSSTSDSARHGTRVSVSLENAIPVPSRPADSPRRVLPRGRIVFTTVNAA
jgi:hypothetical protein